MSRYRELFVAEARSHLDAFSGLIISLEDVADNKEAVNELFRHAHSLKGMAGTMGYDPVAELAHVMESQLSKARNGELTFTAPFVDLMLEARDALAGMVAQVEQGSETVTGNQRLVEAVEQFNGVPPPPADQKREAAPAEGAAVPAFQSRSSDTLSTVRIKTETLDRFLTLTGELITTRHRFAETARNKGYDGFAEPLHELSSLLRDLRDEVLKVRMLPFGTISERFPRLVRDLSRKLSKETVFTLEGHDIELDRGVLEEIAEPLVHILRNAVDHGMETPDERVAAGKAASGSISMTVVRDKDHVEIVISDNGRGMNPEKLKAHAVSKGVMTQEQAALLTVQEALQLICAPGFSTAAVVSDISGRGVGMDAVRSAIHSLGGSLMIQSSQGKGSRFVVRLPISISIISALMVRSGGIDIAFPVASVSRTVELRHNDIIKEAGNDLMALEGEYLPVRSLGALLNQPAAPIPSNVPLPALVCEAGDGRGVFVVDHILGQQEIFIRPLSSPLSLLKGISGASITGAGQVVFIADVSALLQ